MYQPSCRETVESRLADPHGTLGKSPGELSLDRSRTRGTFTPCFRRDGHCKESCHQHSRATWPQNLHPKRV